MNNKPHLIQWHRLMPWKRKLHKIYKVCPEIRWHIDEESKHTIVLFLHMFWYIPVIVIPLVLIGFVLFMNSVFDWLDDFLNDVAFNFIWPFSKRDKSKYATYIEANKILSPEQIRERLDNDENTL